MFSFNTPFKAKRNSKFLLINILKKIQKYHKTGVILSMSFALISEPFSIKKLAMHSFPD